ncbi:hypothetical protein C8Q73DRAFT_718332 [Cubamyces lactineus]|nr:hypothetical protein C8Q73DRAFT_718332 [Cubamyces lactineus]
MLKCRHKGEKKGEKTNAAVSVVVGVTKRRVEWEGEKTRKGQRRSRELEQQAAALQVRGCVQVCMVCGTLRCGEERARTAEDIQYVRVIQVNSSQVKSIGREARSVRMCTQFTFGAKRSGERGTGSGEHETEKKETVGRTNVRVYGDDDAPPEVLRAARPHRHRRPRMRRRRQQRRCSALTPSFQRQRRVVLVEPHHPRGAPLQAHSHPHAHSHPQHHLALPRVLMRVLVRRRRHAPHRRDVQGIRTHPVRRQGRIAVHRRQHGHSHHHGGGVTHQGMREVCGMRRMGRPSLRSHSLARLLSRMASVQRRMRPIRVAAIGVRVVAVVVGSGTRIVVVVGRMTVAGHVREVLHTAHMRRRAARRKRTPIPLREAPHVLLLRVPALALRRLLALLLLLRLLETLAKLLLLLPMELERIVLRLGRQMRVLRELLPEGD